MNVASKKNLACVSLLMIHAIQSTVQWSGSSCPDVIDDDLIINGDCQIPEETNIMALNSNITISIDENCLIQPLTGTPSTIPSTIYLTVNEPYSITLIVKKNLSFKGSPCFKDKPLSIITDGKGSIRLIIEKKGKISFTADDNSGGTEFWSYYTDQSAPKISFVVHHKGQVHFGKRSKWGYILEFCGTSAEGYTTIENHHNTFIVFEDRSSFALEAY
ncbi:hypothetical protein EKK58_03690 [Candidatus Dependentiae bacterium]|nr:MAG: hypothetical protein EKK58_03690 [Candidatus Dependentiae bacterium]